MEIKFFCAHECDDKTIFCIDLSIGKLVYVDIINYHLLHFNI